MPNSIQTTLDQLKSRWGYILAESRWTTLYTTQSYLRSLFWELLNPSVDAFVYFLLIAVIFKRTSIGGSSALLYIVSGLIHYRVFANSISTSLQSIVNSRGILLQMNVPPIIFPLISILRSWESLRYYILPFSIILVFETQGFNLLRLAAYFIGLISILMLSLFAGCTLSYLFVRFRDLDKLVSSVMRIQLYAIPVLWSLSMVPDGLLRKLVQIYPLGADMSLIQYGIAGGTLPNYYVFIWAPISSVIVGALFIMYVSKTNSILTKYI